MEIFDNKTGLAFVHKDTTSFYTVIQITVYYICKLNKDEVMLLWSWQEDVSRVS